MTALQKNAWYNLGVIMLILTAIGAIYPLAGKGALGGFGFLGLLGFGPMFFRQKPGHWWAKSPNTKLKKQGVVFESSGFWRQPRALQKARLIVCAVITLACSSNQSFSQVPVEGGGNPNTPSFNATQLGTIEVAAAYAAQFQWWATAEELADGIAYFEIEDGEGGRLQCLFSFTDDPPSFGDLWWNYFWVDPHPVTYIGQGVAIVGGGGAILVGTGVVAGGGTVIWGGGTVIGGGGGVGAGGIGLAIATEAEAVTALGGFAAVGRAIGMGVGAEAAKLRTASITLA